MRRWAVGALLLAAGCLPRPLAKPPGDPEIGVWVRWWGHSCFSLRDGAGRVFLIDPFDDSVDYPAPRLVPDAVLITHEHFDHTGFPGVAAGPVAGGSPGGGAQAKKEAQPVGPSSGRDSSTAAAPPLPYTVVRNTGLHSVAGVEVLGILGDHDDQGGRRHGMTRLYVWDMGGLRFAHLGDIGQPEPRDDQRAALAGIDVLFIPVGGKTTVDAAAAKRWVDALRPRVVIPMHYGTPRVRFFEFNPLEPFRELFDHERLLTAQEFQLRRADLPSETTLYVPAPPSAAQETP